MAVFISFVKILMFFWPFVKDMLLGKKTFWQAFRLHKIKFLFVFFTIISFGLNFFLIPKTIVIATDNIRLTKELAALQSSPRHTTSGGTEVKQQAQSKVNDTIPVAPVMANTMTEIVTRMPVLRRPTSKAATNAEKKAEEDRRSQIRAEFDEIKRREDNDH